MTAEDVIEYLAQRLDRRAVVLLADEARLLVEGWAEFQATLDSIEEEAGEL